MHHIINLPPLQETNWHCFLLFRWFCKNLQTWIAPAQLKDELNSTPILSRLGLNYYQAGGLDSSLWGLGITPVHLMGGPRDWARKEKKIEKSLLFLLKIQLHHHFSIPLRNVNVLSHRLAVADLTRCLHTEWVLTVGLRVCHKAK